MGTLKNILVPKDFSEPAEQATATVPVLARTRSPDSSLDPSETTCVLEALSTLDADESSTAWAGLDVKPTGLTSLLTEW